MLKTYFLISLLIVVILGVFQIVYKTEDASLDDKKRIVYQIYPDTDDYPVLDLKWDIQLSNKTIKWIGAFGLPEISNTKTKSIGPADEIEIHFYTDVAKKNVSIFAPAEGVVTSITPESENGTYQIWIRYGRNFAYAFYFVKDIPPSIKEGSIIKKHQLLGYVPIIENSHGFWEMVTYIKKGDRFYYHLPIDFFSKKDKEIFRKIWYSDIPRDDRAKGFWTVSDMWGEVGEHKEHEDIYDRGWHMGYR